MRIMAGRSPVVAREEQRHELLTLSQSRERGEADRARALLLTLAGWTSPRIDAAGEFVGMPGTGDGLVAPTPDRPGDDKSRIDATLDQTPGNTTDLLE